MLVSPRPAGAFRLGRVNPEIEPEPSEQEREAILRALEAEGETPPPAYRSRWRQAGVEESVEDAEE
jgi:hypothetical protein